MIGKEILNYIITSKIGSGGMGSVFLAEHKFIKQQKVAIKVIKGELFNDFAKNKLKEEAERLASLNHPYIVKFLNYDIDADGNVYLIMEYAEGVTLDQYINLKTGLIVEEKILPLFEPILETFDYAHKKKVVHRDIKPANIIITTEGIPRILDFGISTIVDDFCDEDRQEAFIMGTPSYMSPEQVIGKGIDTRSDIYSLGVLLYQMLTGNPPYDTTTLSEQDINEKVVTEPLPRMKSFYHYVSDKMQVIVDKATSKDPKDRYQTCAEFQRAMRKALVPKSVSKFVLWSVAAIVILLIGGCGYWWDYNRLKISYYKDYVEQWGIPQGIGKLSNGEKKHMCRMYRFEYKKHKLLRVSNVNSLGYVIDDDEPERNERPLDMCLFYSSNGKISSIKVYDRSGKVLYVKSFNDKLNSIVFQYDDKFGTEKSLGVQTIGYGNFLSNDEDTKGRITRYLIEYDRKGYISSIHYAGFQNVRVSDVNNIYGRNYVRDDKGRVVEEHYLGFDGSPKSTKWGLGIKKFYYDNKDNWIKAEYLTVDGNPALDSADGVCIYTMEYDEYGNLRQAFYRNSDGSLMIPKKHGLSSVRYVYDNRGMIVKIEFLGIDGQPCFSKENVAKRILSYDENGYINRVFYYDVEGNLCLTKSGYASVTSVNDGRGNPTETWYYGLNGELVINSDGVAGYRFKYDSIGNEVERVYYGIDENPCLDSDGSCGYWMRYDDKNLVTKLILLGANLSPAKNNDGVAIVSAEYDQRGNLNRIAFYDEQEKKMVLSNSAKYAGGNFIYDENGNLIEENFFDVNNKPCLCDENYAKQIKTYDENGNLIRSRYYNLSGELTLVDGVVGYDYKYDERGNVLEDVGVGLNGHLAPGKLIRCSKYDNNDNIIELAYYMDNNQKATCSMNFHKCIFTYNNRNQCIECCYYNTTGNLTCYGDDTYAIQLNEYDARGNRILSRYLGTDRSPICCNGGWASYKAEYDAVGNVIKVSFYDINGKPTNPEVTAPECFFRYDMWGNMIYIAASDGQGNLIMDPHAGWCICKREFDLYGNILVEAYYDTHDKQVVSKEGGYHKVVNEYTASGKEKQTCYYGTDGKPITCNDKYHKIIYDYNEHEQLISESYWDTSGRPTECPIGFHKMELSYNEFGETAVRKFYNSSNQLLLTQTWNGIDWDDMMNNDWIVNIHDMNAECPFNFGEDLNYLVLTSVKVTGSYSCRFTFKIPYSKYELSSEDSNNYKTWIAELIAYYKQESLPSNIMITGILCDCKDREIYKTSK